LLAVGLAASAIHLGAGGACAAAPGKSYFFATRDACAASGVFQKRECDGAFVNARAELRDRAPRFSSSAECRIRFHLCEMRKPDPRDDEENSATGVENEDFIPLALGVEMVASLKGVEATPVLAVETPPRLFPRYPVSRLYEVQEKAPPEREASAQGAILPADHFEPFPKRAVPDSARVFSAYTLGALDDASSSAASLETPEDRRRRLKNAPFIE